MATKGRTPRPWYWADRDAWYVTLDGKRHRLASGRKARGAATAEFARLMASSPPVPPGAPGRGVASSPGEPDLTVARLADLWLAHSRLRHKPATASGNASRLRLAVRTFGRLKVAQIEPQAIQAWLAAHPRSPSTHRAWVVTLRSAIRWARSAGHLPPDCDPLAGLRLPADTCRERTLTAAERRTIDDAACPEFRLLLRALWLSGARPHVLYDLEARHIDWRAGVAIVPSKGRPYTLTLTPDLAAMLKPLAVRSPTGPLLRSTRGGRWTRNAVRCQFRRLAQRTGIEGVTAYAYRHSFATDALERGEKPAVVAALLNHRDLSMLSRYYNHVGKRHEVLRQAAQRITRPEGEDKGKREAG
jgi:integrase